MVFNDIFMLSHLEMEGPLRYRQLRKYANRRNIHVRQIRHLRDRLNPLEEYDDEDFRLRFRLTKGSVSDLVKILDKDLQHQARRSAAYTNAASASCFEILCDRNLLEGYWRFIWCFCICCMHSHSQGFKGYCETKRTIPVIPREPG